MIYIALCTQFKGKLNLIQLNKYLGLVIIFTTHYTMDVHQKLGSYGSAGVCMLETMDGEITLEMETQWEGNCSCILSVGLPMGISLPAEVGSLPTFGEMQYP